MTNFIIAVSLDILTVFHIAEMKVYKDFQNIINATNILLSLETVTVTTIMDFFIFHA